MLRPAWSGFPGCRWSCGCRVRDYGAYAGCLGAGYRRLRVADGNSASLEGATRAGAEVGKANPSVTGAQLTALNLFPSGITPTVTSVCSCVDNTAVACPTRQRPQTHARLPTRATPVTNPYTNLPDSRVFKYVNVTAAQTVSPIVSYGTFTSAKSVNVNTTIRTQ